MTESQACILVVGSANVDLTTFTDAFPRAGETIFGRRFDLGFGGKGANQAAAAPFCGASVHVVARVGNDLFGPATIENFESLGIGARHVKMLEGDSSGVAPIFVDANGENQIIVVKGANDALDIPNESEASTKMPVSNVDEAKRVAEYLLSKGFRRIVLTLGAKGALLASSEEMVPVPSYPVETVDSTGAGDAFIGSFAVLVAKGVSELEAVARANLNAALSTTGVGTQKSFVRRSTFEREWRERAAAG